MKYIKFFSRSSNPDHKYLSNFTKSSIKIGPKIWPSVEHYFQAMKYNNLIKIYKNFNKDNEIIKFTLYGKYGALPASKIKKYGGKKHMEGLGVTLNLKIWNTVKRNIMIRAIKERFNCDFKFRSILLDLAQQNICLLHHEYSKNTPYWGCYYDKGGEKFIGKNNLGIIMMNDIYY